MKLYPILMAMFCVLPGVFRGQEKVNPDAQLVADFQKCVADYVKLHQAAHSRLPALKPTNSTAVIDHHEHALAREIREMRRSAQPGDIFTPAIAQEFRRLLGIAMQGTEKHEIRRSIQDTQPVRGRPLRVNESYPAGAPLPTVPPSLLLNLPPLPPEVEYRIVGTDLILHDVEANLIVDWIPDAISRRT